MGICCSQFGVCGQHQLRGELQNGDLSRVKCLLALAHKEDLFPVGKVASTAPISFFFCSFHFNCAEFVPNQT